MANSKAGQYRLWCGQEQRGLDLAASAPTLCRADGGVISAFDVVSLAILPQLWKLLGILPPPLTVALNEIRWTAKRGK